MVLENTTRVSLVPRRNGNLVPHSALSMSVPSAAWQSRASHNSIPSMAKSLEIQAAPCQAHHPTPEARKPEPPQPEPPQAAPQAAPAASVRTSDPVTLDSPKRLPSVQEALTQGLAASEFILFYIYIYTENVTLHVTHIQKAYLYMVRRLAGPASGVSGPPPPPMVWSGRGGGGGGPTLGKTRVL